MIGRIQADGYVYIHSKRVCRVSSDFIERITPLAWDAGKYSTYGGRVKEQVDDRKAERISQFLGSKFFLLTVVGVVVGIVAMTKDLIGIEGLFVGPLFVYLMYGIIKFVNAMGW